MHDWFKKAFDENYLTVYSHRDGKSAQREVKHIVGLMDLKKGQHVLDLGCGQGRHCNALVKYNLKVWGLDLSMELLNLRQRTRNKWYPVLGDMLQLPFKQYFNAVLSLFTSFGYFLEGELNRRVLKQVHRVLVENGKVFIDFLNRPNLEKNMKDISRNRRGPYTVIEKRNFSMDKKRVQKHVEIRQGTRLIKQYMESVRAYSREELILLLEKTGFNVLQTYGDLAGNEWTEQSPRLVIIAVRR
jgi:ubiquinone/menaquinone biosynthesis C-methylase UbiE